LHQSIISGIGLQERLSVSLIRQFCL